jgi:hypothetical protein
MCLHCTPLCFIIKLHVSTYLHTPYFVIPPILKPWALPLPQILVMNVYTLDNSCAISHFLRTPTILLGSQKGPWSFNRRLCDRACGLDLTLAIWETFSLAYLYVFPCASMCLDPCHLRKWDAAFLHSGGSCEQFLIKMLASQQSAQWYGASQVGQKLLISICDILTALPQFFLAPLAISNF